MAPFPDSQDNADNAETTTQTLAKGLHSIALGQDARAFPSQRCKLLDVTFRQELLRSPLAPIHRLRSVNSFQNQGLGDRSQSITAGI